MPYNWHFSKHRQNQARSTKANLQHISTISTISLNIQIKCQWYEIMLYNISTFNCLVFLFTLRNMLEILIFYLVQYYIFCVSSQIYITFLQKDDLAFYSHFQPLQENVYASALTPTRSGIFLLTTGFFWN